VFLRILIIFVSFSCIGGFIYAKRKQIHNSYKAWYLVNNVGQQPQPEKYRILKQDLALYREELGKAYKGDVSESQKDEILQQSRALLEASLPEMMRCWLGTPWDYSGTARSPGEEKIACGYFVSTILRDAGFQVDRSKLAQQASQYILETFVPREQTTKRIGSSYRDFSEELIKSGDGVYVVGLDTHVAFLIVSEGTFHLIHSTSSQPWGVVDELPHQAGVLKKSRYRIYGSLTAQKHLLEKWLLGERFPVKAS